MKKQIFYIAIFLLSLSSAYAQQTTVGAGLAYGSEVEQAGIVINGQYFFNDKVAVAPSLLFYFPNTQRYSGSGFTTEARTSVWEFNADVNYYFYSKDMIKLFGVGGLNITGIKSTVKTTGNFNQKNSASDTEAGINLGIGTDVNLGSNIVPFIVLKYTVSDFDQLVIQGGVRFVIK
jgi:opacity protein-like surface antigen